MIKKILILSVFFFANFAYAKTASENFLTVADIHFDPFLECKHVLRCELIQKLQTANPNEWEMLFERYHQNRLSQASEDTNYLLLRSSLGALQKESQSSHSLFVLILGDLLAHNFRIHYIEYTRDFSKAGFQNFAKKTMEFLALELQKTFSIPIYPVIGNNDSYTGDYSVKINGPFLQDTQKIWGNFITNAGNKNSFNKDFGKGGYYSVTVPNHNQLKIILLNSVLFSVHSSKSMKEEAKAELTWLDRQLTSAKLLNQHVLLVDHIPVGVDLHATLHNFLKSLKEFWVPYFTQEFENIIARYPTNISAILSAHIHRDTFQLVMRSELANIPVLFNPAISPIFGNNPAFKIYSFNPDNFEIIDYTTYYLPAVNNAVWQKEYSFDTIYRHDCKGCTIAEVIKKINLAA